MACGCVRTEENLTSAILATMNPKKRAHWEEFLETAQKEIAKNDRDGNELPYEPSDSLKMLFRILCMNYDGWKYRQMHHYAKAFGFLG